MHLLRADADITNVSHWLGHADLSTTNRYVETDMEMKRRMIEKLNPPKAQNRKPWQDPKVLDFLDNLARRPQALCELR